MEVDKLDSFRARAFSLLSIVGMTGFCQVMIIIVFDTCLQFVHITCKLKFAPWLQVSVPLGVHDGLPVSVSLVAKHGADGFLLHVAQTLHSALKEQASIVWKVTK